MQEKEVLRWIGLCFCGAGVVVPAALAVLASALIRFPIAAHLYCVYLFLACELVALIAVLVSGRLGRRPVVACMVVVAVSALAGGLGYFGMMVVVAVAVG